MTNLEVLEGDCLYPVKATALSSAIVKRGLTPTDTFDAESDVNVKGMELAKADLYILLLTAPLSVTEGGYSLSAPQAKELKDLAENIYSKYGYASPVKRSTVTGKSVW